MPSYLHELLLALFRNHPASATDLLRELAVELPEHDELRTEASDINDLRPAEYRADSVLFLVRESQYVLGVIVEVQLGCDPDKPFAWPAYIANLRARHRCPVCLLVVTVEESVSQWAGRLIDLGPGSQCRPFVVGPSNTPVVTEPEDAEKNVELAVLSAIEHGQISDTALAARIASVAIVASAGIDSERCRLYHDLILTSLAKNARQTIEDTMNSPKHEFRDETLRRWEAEGIAAGMAKGMAQGMAQGKVEGKAEGRIELILELLARRFGPLEDGIQTRVRCAQEAQLGAVTERMMTAQTLEQALGSLY